MSASAPLGSSVNPIDSAVASMRGSATAWGGVLYTRALSGYVNPIGSRGCGLLSTYGASERP